MKFINVKLVSSLLLLNCAGCASIQHGAATRTEQMPPRSSISEVQAAPPTRQISMNGYGKVFYDADVCDLWFSVTTNADDDLSVSFDTHREKVAEISQFMMTYGGPETICAAKSTVLLRTERRVGNVQVEAYQYVTDFSARFKIFEDIGVVQKELITRGVNQISGMELRSSKYNEILRKARDLAVSDAREKVAYIGEVMGWEIEEIANVVLQGENVRSWAWGGPAQQRFGHRGAHIESTDSAFETYIDATVQVTFALKKID